MVRQRYRHPRLLQDYPAAGCPREEAAAAVAAEPSTGNHYTLEQKELKARLKEQSIENPDQIDLEAAIKKMEEEQEIRIVV